jgi:hypothetical protein
MRAHSPLFTSDWGEFWLAARADSRGVKGGCQPVPQVPIEPAQRLAAHAQLLGCLFL